jgi:hypothetical protein
LQQTQLDKFPEPHKRDIKVLRAWFDRKDYGENFLAGTTNPEWIWDTEKGYTDFMTMQEGGGIVYQTARFFAYLSRCCGSNRRGRVYSADSTAAGSTARVFSTVVSTMIPIIPIFALAFVNALWIRLLIILAFTALFSFVLVYGVRMTPDQTLAVTLA